MMIRALAFVLAATVGCLLAVSAQTARSQDKPQEQRPAATFRSGVDLVAVEASVVDPRGRPVSDLTPEDFVLMVDGRPRPLVSVQFISHAGGAKAPARTEGFSTNAGAESGRLIMLVVDQSNIHRGSSRTYIEAASQFVDRLNPADRVGLTVIPGVGSGVDFTANHALVKTLLTRVTGVGEIPVGLLHIGVAEAVQLIVRQDRFVMSQIVERECGWLAGDADLRECQQQIRTEAQSVLAYQHGQTNDLLIALRVLLGRLAATHEPKTLVLVSEGLILENRAQLAFVGPLAASARASLYVLRLDASTIDVSDARVAASAHEDRQLGIQGLEDLAGRSRGAIFPVASSPERVFDRLALELSGYYSLSFEPERSDRDGRTHTIEVKVRRAGVEIRARREFVVDPARSTMTDEDLLAETLRSPLLATEVSVKVTTYTLRDVASGKLKVIIAAEIDRRASPSGAVALGYALVDNAGKLAATELREDLQPSASDQATQRYTGAALVDPGIYTLKLAVVDAKGKRGSVEHTLRAQLQSAGQLRFGELLLASIAPGAGREIQPLVDGEVVTDDLRAYLEMYSDAAAQLETASVTLEVAADPNGRALESGALAMQDVEQGRRRVGEGRVPLALLPPGRYVARAVVSVGGRVVAGVTRPFSISRALATSISAAAPVASAAVSAAGGVSSVALAMSVGPFDRQAVLGPPVVDFFLGRMFTRDTAAAAAPLRPAIEAARDGRFDGVSAEIDRLGPEAATDLVPTFLVGLVLFSRGELEPAAAKFREAIRLDSEFFPAAFYLGACYAAGGRDREAAGAWQTSLVAESDAPFVFTLLADALLRLGEAGQAMDLLREAGALWPDNDEVRMRMGMAFAMGGFAPEAIATLDPYLGRHPADHERLFLAMRLLYEIAASDTSVGTPDEHAARFGRYAKAYGAAAGPHVALVEEWQKYVESKKAPR